MSHVKRLSSGVALAALSLSLFGWSGAAFAQSTGSQQAESELVIVTAQRNRTTAGLIENEKTPKTRSTITAEYIATQPTGQTVIQSLNLVPGLNFTNSDAYGSSGGNVRLRGFDGNRISLTVDGIPLNDTGNYAIFTNQQLDGEYISRTTVNTGTTDVDSPSASATGGTINLRMRRPDDTRAFRATLSAGSSSYGRGLLIYDTGKFGPWDTTAFIGGSYQQYSKFKGPGELEKQQYNARIFQKLNDTDFVSLSFHYNENRNAFYRNGSLAQWAFYGPKFDNLASCTRVAGVAGTAQNEGSTTVASDPNFLSSADNPANASSCTNFFGLRINPSNTGNIRGSSSFQLMPNLRLTVDPTYQYVLANGGGTTVVSETDRRLRGPGATPTAAGVDLNGDGDVLDSVRLYTPNNTNTNRVGVNASLIWDINDNSRLRVAYTFDYGRHRQTGEFTRLSANGNPLNVFGGREGPKVFGADGSFLRGRDRFSIAQLNQIAIDYNGLFFEDKLRVNIGVRAPFFERQLDQRCYSQNGTSNVLCTTETPNATLANRNVTFASTGSTQYIAPYKATRKYDAVLPNISASYEFLPNNSVYASYAEGFSAPRTDNLYTPLRFVTGAILLNNAVPETTQSFDIGYRYQGQNLTTSVALWNTKYDNRIVTAFDDTLGINVDRNVGSVDLQGLDLELGWRVSKNFTAYASASFNDSELKNNVPLSATTALPTAGKKLVETPDSTYALRLQYEIDGLTLGLQGKQVSERFSTDVNDEAAPAYVVVDLDASYDFEKLGAKNTVLQLNIINLFDEGYYGNISSTNNALAIANVSTVTGTTVARSGSAPSYSLGAPRTVQVTLRTKF
ncbi:ferric-pseudobactin 358 receptor [Candidatus Phycosocius bacilliformis]|uniref:Ferric-pseudobactin 358 receptor n=1 Tax=Candidatus Phycosocius bacilliformis TaxID=1445552 RepID=A0A2P2E9U5_9PROT|nr:TonB-dependent receptor [Candidatus Phycosocius bacilliformis]GBF57832.1 ferric-pseudobactin 358 receptor [Candidatus Phycosocius bacilliformis]